ncbi:MAG: FlgD immunoglobulin-like domain containing protein [Candidatus Krumholzibacteriia bacterium]
MTRPSSPAVARPVLAAAILVLAAAAAAAVIFPFDPIGAVDPLVNGISQDWANNDVHLFVTTEEGFYAWDQPTQTWDDHTLPGWIGVARTAIVPVEGLPQRRVLGGVNAFFKGTLWLSDDEGATQDLTRESTGGRVTDIARSRGDQVSLIYACTWSDVAPGELVRSVDDGATWTAIGGHGHTNLTGVEIVADRELYVSGDNFVTRTLDDGATWEHLQGNLPAGQGLAFVRALEPVTALPKAGGDRQIQAEALLVSNDSGLYLTQAAEIDWREILPASCRAADEAFHQLDTFVLWTETWVVTFDGRLLLAIDRDWDRWYDVTDELGGAVPLDVVAFYGGVYVLTREDGVFYSRGHDFPTGGPPPPSQLALQAAPNPFNPRTTVSFALPQAGTVELLAFDLRGRRVARLAGGFLAAGRHQVAWDASDDAGRGLPSGVYLLRLTSAQGVKASRVALVR